MQKFTALALSMLLIIFFSCNNTQKTNEVADTETDSTTVADEASSGDLEEESKTENIDPENAKSIQAKFIMVATNTDGALFIFEDKNGEKYEFRDIGSESKGLEFTKGLQPNVSPAAYDKKWFEVKYEKRKMEFYDGGSGEYVERVEPVILSVVEIDQPELPAAETVMKAGIAEDLKKAVFFGTEPFWALRLYEDYAEYEAMGQEPEKMLYYKKQLHEPDNCSLTEAIQKFGEGVLIVCRFTEMPNTITLTITEEACSDGMSDNIYPYKIIFDYDEAPPEYGCGRIDK